MEWINNPWVVGIGGGLLSGFLVTLVTRFLLSRGSRKEYKRKLKQANREIISSLKSSVSEGTVPTREVVESLINATTRKHNIDAQDAYGVAEVAEELSKEVMDSSFLSARDKSDFCDDILHLKRVSLDSQDVKGKKPKGESGSDFSSPFIRRLSVLAGSFVAMLSLINTVITDRQSFDTSLLEQFIPIISVLIATLAFSLAYLVFVRRRGKREESELRQESTEDRKDENNDTEMAEASTNGSAGKSKPESK